MFIKTYTKFLFRKLKRIIRPSIRTISKTLWTKQALPVKFHGYNWQSDKELPVAILYGFPPWKRSVISSYLSEYKTAFSLGRASFLRIRKEILSNLPNDQKLVFIGWGNNLPLSVRFYARLAMFSGKQIEILRIEDGFLRSIGGGLLHTRPASLCIDNAGIYFDAKKPSALEIMIATFDFDANQALIDRSEQCIQLFKAARLTKYYNERPYPDANQFEHTKKYSILVIGQVEDDASIIAGKTKISRNRHLILAARKENPAADIYYRPHPDYFAGNRKARSRLKDLSAICAIVPPTTSLYDLFQVVDHVYTMTSLAGFEALLYGLKVTTFGAPFYSNWGLTDDRVEIKRRERKITLPQLFAATHLLHPTYMHLLSDETSTFEKTASYFIVESLKDEDIFRLTKKELYTKTTPHKEQLAAPFRLLCYLNETGNFAEAHTPDVMDIINSDFTLADYPQISFLLSKTSNYDELVAYSDRCIGYLSENIAGLIYNTTLIENFFYSLSLALKNSNGRVIQHIPNLTTWFLSLTSSDKNFNRLLTNYVRCLSNNLQYEIIEELIYELSHTLMRDERATKFEAHRTLDDVIQQSFQLNATAGLYRSIAQILGQKPSRSERDAARRHRMTVAASQQYADLLDAKYPSPMDALLNRTLYWHLLNEPVQTARDFTQILEHFGSKATIAATRGKQQSNVLRTDFQANADADDDGTVVMRSGDATAMNSDAEGKTRILGEDDTFDILDSGAMTTAFRRRQPDLVALGNYLLKNGEFKLVEQIIGLLPQNPISVTSALLRLNLHKTQRDRQAFFRLASKLPNTIKTEEKFLGLYARLLREMGLFEQSKNAYQEVANKAKTLAKRVAVETDISKIEFCQQTSKILNAVPQPNLPKGVVFLASQTCFNTLAMMAPSLLELKKKGYAVINLTEGMTELSPTGLDFIDQFAGAIPLSLTHPHLKIQWTIDWDKKNVEAKGINFYQGFYEHLSVYIRRYHVDLNMPLANKAFRSTLLRADMCLLLCETIHSEIVGRGMPVSFVSGNSHVTPFSVFRDFARHKDHPLLNFINCNVAYEAYFSNLGSKFANTMCVTDMTLHKNIRAPFMARKDQFDRWYEVNKENPEYIQKSNELIKVNRVGSTTDTKEQEIIEYIQTQKAAGKKIVCAFGKVPVDLNVPYDGGPAHEDMADWISHTVEICNKAENVILLVKPHPHELRPEIALDLIGTFHDLITVNPEDNVKLLGHQDINGHALAPYLDLAILYNGSSGVELAAQGVPVIMASYFGNHDYPVDLLYPESREQYARFVQSADYPQPTEDTRRKAAFLLCYLGTDEISILNQYSLRQLTNDKIGVPQWREEKITHFLQNGDPKMELIANRIVEKFENPHKDHLINSDKDLNQCLQGNPYLSPAEPVHSAIPLSL